MLRALFPLTQALLTQQGALLLCIILWMEYSARHTCYHFAYALHLILRSVEYGARNRLATVFWYLQTVEDGGDTTYNVQLESTKYKGDCVLVPPDGRGRR